MIVKDEEQNLPACLAGLDRLVDEVVIYDTGSTDGTVALARAAGARVVEGYWDDDFSRARNAALAHCRGRWVLHVDADEVVEADASALRSLLAGTRQEAFVVPILNLTDHGEVGATEHRATRLFRRAAGHWVNRLHEQVVARAGGRELVTAVAPAVRLVHSGYRSEAVAKRHKAERNLRLAEADLADADSAEAPSDRAALLLSVARSLIVASRWEEALPYLAEARELPTGPVVRRQVLRHGADTLLVLGRPSEALDWIDALEACSERTEMVRSLRGMARMSLGDGEGALRCFEGLTEVVDDDGITESRSLTRQRVGLSAAAAGRWELAADELLAVVSERDCADPVWAPLLEAHRRTGRDLGPVAAAVPVATLTPVLAQVLLADPEVGDELAERLWRRLDADPRLLAFAVRAAPRLPRLERALEWSTRLRLVGLEEHCPLASVALDRHAPPVRRVEAAALAFAAFGDGIAPIAVRKAAADVPSEALGALLVELAELAPGLLQPLVTGAASTPARCLALARLLEGLGAPDEAMAVLDHGVVALGAPAGLVEEAAGWLCSVRGPEAARRLRASAAASPNAN